MNYLEWAEEYYENARRVLEVIEKKKKNLYNKRITADMRKSLCDAIKAYRRIYYELRDIGDTLSARGREHLDEA